MPRYQVEIEGTTFDVTLEYGSERFRATINGKTYEITHQALGESRSLLFIEHESLEVDVHRAGGNGHRVLFMKGHEIPALIEDYSVAQMRKAAGISHGATVETMLKAPMPGLIISVRVAPGERVTKGQPLAVIEAMKMENIIKAKHDGVVKAVHVTSGKSVEKGDTLLEFA